MVGESRACANRILRTPDRVSRQSPRAGSSSTCATPSGGPRSGQGARCGFENEYGDPPVEFAQLGINVTVLEPGQTVIYHAEANQEAFLVVSGECALLVENEERRLGPWDFFHAPPWTEHGFVGAGEGPCVILMAGSRSGAGVHYPVPALAAQYGASVAEETSDWREANAAFERFGRQRPPSWPRLPWA